MLLLSLSALLCATFATAISIPLVRKASIKYGLVDNPNPRRVHKGVVPLLGGVGIFFALIFNLSVLGALAADNTLFVILGGASIMFFTGLKDDTISLSPMTKLWVQLFVACMIIVLSDLCIGSLDGLFGIQEIPWWAGVILSVFVLIVIINSVNLIDGIDGLAGGIGLLSALFFGLEFYNLQMKGPALVSFSLLGSCIVFMYFNFSKRHKIFLGDTGSLLIGFLIASLTMIYLKVHQGSSELVMAHPDARHPSLVAISLLIYPFTDTLRVFIVRIYQGYSPFRADKSHLHHLLIDRGMSHGLASLLIYVYTLIGLGISYFILTDCSYLLHLLCIIAWGFLGVGLVMGYRKAIT